MIDDEFHFRSLTPTVLTRIAVTLKHPEPSRPSENGDESVGSAATLAR
jgi:hypothetical protein